MHARKEARTCTHARMHARTHARTRARVYVALHTYKAAHLYPRAFIYARTQSFISVCLCCRERAAAGELFGGWPEVVAVTTFAVTNTFGSLTGVAASAAIRMLSCDRVHEGRGALMPVGGAALVWPSRGSAKSG